MAVEGFDYAAVIADLEAKKLAIENSLLSLRLAQASGALGAQSDFSGVSGSPSGGPMELPKNAFVGKSIPVAVVLYLSAVKRKQTLSEVATALEDGGAESTAKNFETVVAGALYRLKDAGKVVRFKDGWMLAEQVHGSLRAVVEKASKSESRKKAKKPKRGARVQKKEKTTEPNAPKGAGLESRIHDTLRSNPQKSFSAAEIATTLNLGHAATVSMSLGRMVAKKKAEKTTDGKYKAA
jgi:hypothetical protein